MLPSPVASVRRRSCVPTPTSPISSRIRSKARDAERGRTAALPATGEGKSQGLFPVRFSAPLRMLTANGGSGSACSRRDFVLSAGTVQMPYSRLTSLLDASSTSLRRSPRSHCSLSASRISLDRPDIASSVSHSVRISCSERTRCRGRPAFRFFRPNVGLASSRPVPAAQL